MEALNNPNVIPIDKPNKINRVLSLIFFVFVGITLIFLSIYLYNLYRPSEKSKSVVYNNEQATPAAMTPIPRPIVIDNSKPTISIATLSLPQATVGKKYSAVIFVNVYNVRTGDPLYGIDPAPFNGLNLTSCALEYDNAEAAKFAATNTVAKCTIDGTPQQSGYFTVKFYFSIYSGSPRTYALIPLIVSP